MSGASLRCAVCHDALGARPEVCAGCGTQLHADCRALAGGCPTLGCAAAGARAACSACDAELRNAEAVCGGCQARHHPACLLTACAKCGLRPVYSPGRPRRLIWAGILLAAAYLGVELWLEGQDWWTRRATIAAARELARTRGPAAVCDFQGATPPAELTWLARLAGVPDERGADLTSSRELLLDAFTGLDEPVPSCVVVHYGCTYLYLPSQDSPGWGRAWIVSGTGAPLPELRDPISWGRRNPVEVCEGVWQLTGPNRD